MTRSCKGPIDLNNVNLTIVDIHIKMILTVSVYPLCLGGWGWIIILN